MSGEAAGANRHGVGPNWPAVISGASRGFTVLLLGGVVQPWIVVLSRPLGYVWLPLVAVTAFAWAAWPREAAGLPPSAVRSDRFVVGVAAALGSYTLVFPIVLMAAGEVPWSQLALTSLTAVVVGGLVGWAAPLRS